MESSTPVNVSNPSASKRATSITSATTSFASRSADRTASQAVRACLLFVCLAGFVATAARAEVDPRDQWAAGLEARLERLRERDEAAHAQAAIERARAALAAASSARDTAAATRQQDIAQAALVLAERQVERRRIQAELIATQRRLTATRERANAQRRVLEALMKERAALARAQESP